MKLIHLSDLHLGRRFKEFSLLEDQRDILLRIIAVIDAEKPADSDDSELSASAAASNMLVYSGWAAQIDPALKLLSEDDLFAKMIPEFSGMADDYLSEFDTLGTLESPGFPEQRGISYSL